jgi:hypothetical protein
MVVFVEQAVPRKPAVGWLTVGDTAASGALLQATVVARTGIEADALSTALLVSAAAAPGVLEWFSPAPLGASAPAIGGGRVPAVSSGHSPTS